MLNFEIQNRKLIKHLEDKGIHDKRILDAILKTPRHLFIPKNHQDFSYEDFPIPIGNSATISQPFTVAFMLQELEVKEGQKILEIGTGSGWNAALLSTLVGEKGKVITIEIIKELYNFGKKNLRNYKNVKVILADGSKGYPKEAPYHGIIATAAAPEIPESLISQLKNKGRIIIPVGSLFEQRMIKVTKKDGKLKKENLGLFTFVPLKGKFGHQEFSIQ